MDGGQMPPGWYRHPTDPPTIVRFWNGAQWSGPHMLPGQQPGAAPGQPGAAGPGVQGGYGNPAYGATGYQTPGYGAAPGYADAPAGGATGGWSPHEPQPDLDTRVGLVPRIVARAADLLIQWAIFLVLLLPSAEVSVGTRGFWSQLPGFSSASVIWSVVAGAIAFFAWEWAWLTQRGTTPGKQLVSAWVAVGRPISSASSASPGEAGDEAQAAAPSFAADAVPPGGIPAAVRSAVRIVFGVPYLGLVALLIDAVASLWFIANDGDHRTAMDRTANTSVVSSHPFPRRNRLRSQSMWLITAAVGFLAAAWALWTFVHQPVMTAAEEVLTDIRDNNLAEATASFAESCPVDRAAYATYFSQNQIATFELDSVDIDWAVPLFSEDQERSRATVTGTATIVGSDQAAQRVKVELVREDTWRVCDFIE